MTGVSYEEFQEGTGKSVFNSFRNVLFPNGVMSQYKQWRSVQWYERLCSGKRCAGWWCYTWTPPANIKPLRLLQKVVLIMCTAKEYVSLTPVSMMTVKSVMMWLLELLIKAVAIWMDTSLWGHTRPSKSQNCHPGVISLWCGF